MVADRVAEGRVVEDADVRTVGREDLGAGVVFAGGTGVDDAVMGGGATVVVDVDVGAVEDDGVERELLLLLLLLAGVLEAVLVGAVDIDGEPPPPPVPHPATVINSTGTARNRRRTLGTVIDRCPRMRLQGLGKNTSAVKALYCGAGPVVRNRSFSDHPDCESQR